MLTVSKEKRKELQACGQVCGQMFPLFAIVTVVPSESTIHTQPLEEFYKSAENYYPFNRKNSRIQSAPAPRDKPGKMSSRSAVGGARTAQLQGKQQAVTYKYSK